MDSGTGDLRGRDLGNLLGEPADPLEPGNPRGFCFYDLRSPGLGFHRRLLL